LCWFRLFIVSKLVLTSEEAQLFGKLLDDDPVDKVGEDGEDEEEELEDEVDGAGENDSPYCPLVTCSS
jgi:hypothetical protein